MKPLKHLWLLLSITIFAFQGAAQSSTIRQEKEVPFLPPSTVIHKDIVFKKIGNKALKLDIYLPNKTAQNIPLLVWIHGGAWFRGNKTKFLNKGWNNNLVNRLLKDGYAIAAISYRLSQEAIFPAQIQDCNDAITYLLQNSAIYKLDKDRIAVMGRSAGGHLASLVATSNSYTLPNFYSVEKQESFPIRAVIDLWGVSDFLAMRGNTGRVDHDADDSAEAKLLGHNPLTRPDLANLASPTTYINEQTPPFLMIHGKIDDLVPYSQSVLLQSYLNLANIENKLILVEDAKHGGAVMDTEQYVAEIADFLEMYIPIYH